MYNVLFPSGRVMEFGTIAIATIYVKAYNGSLLPQIKLDRNPMDQYNGCVVNDEQNLETL